MSTWPSTAQRCDIVILNNISVFVNVFQLCVLVKKVLERLYSQCKLSDNEILMLWLWQPPASAKWQVPFRAYSIRCVLVLFSFCCIILFVWFRWFFSHIFIAAVKPIISGHAPTTFEWSTILLPSKVRLILEVWWYFPFITRVSEVIMFTPCVFVCLWLCLCLYHDVCPDDLTMKDWCQTNNILQVHCWGCRKCSWLSFWSTQLPV